jgi:hypothetical protein
MAPDFIPVLIASMALFGLFMAGLGYATLATQDIYAPGAVQHKD